MKQMHLDSRSPYYLFFVSEAELIRKRKWVV